MAEKSKNANQRLKILYLYKIFLQKTDANHPITMQQIIAELELYGISAARKALYEDIEALKLFGLDICSIKGKYSGYYVKSRDFELPELRLLADAVTSSRFLTESKSKELLKKIEGLASVYEGSQIQRQVFVADRVKAVNETIYRSVDSIHRAVAEKKQITFRYFDYGTDKKKKYREGMRVCSPYALTWSDERYYLVAYYEKYGGMTNFRVDKMEAVSVIDKPAHPCPEGFSLSDYLNSTFSMFSGETQEVKLRFHNSLVNAVVDRFGSDVRIIPDGGEHFTVRVNVKTEQPFFGWLFQFGTKVRIVAPESLKERYAEKLREALESTGL
jgi:predicted DNA-binding transcriptional regulator YafY